MSELTQEQKWYSVYSPSPFRELQIRDDARRYGLESFVPLKYTVKVVRRQRQRTLVPALANLIFIKGTLNELKDYLANTHYVVYMRKSTFSNKRDYLTVPTKAMENFIAVTVNREEHITYFHPQEIALNAGDQIRIKGGLYDGREGVIMRIKGKRNRHLVVQIPGMLVAAVELSPEMIELPSEPASGKSGTVRERKSKDITKDKRILMEGAHRLLFEFADKYRDENEYYLLQSEVRRARLRLLSFRGYTPATEAELALPMYLAAVQLQEDVESAESRLLKAIDRLKPTSLLRLKCQCYLAVLSHDETLRASVQSTMLSWSKPCSTQQQSLCSLWAVLNS